MLRSVVHGARTQAMRAGLIEVYPQQYIQNDAQLFDRQRLLVTLARAPT